MICKLSRVVETLPHKPGVTQKHGKGGGLCFILQIARRWDVQCPAPYLRRGPILEKDVPAAGSLPDHERLDRDCLCKSDAGGSPIRVALMRRGVGPPCDRTRKPRLQLCTCRDTSPGCVILKSSPSAASRLLSGLHWGLLPLFAIAMRQSGLDGQGPRRRPQRPGPCPNRNSNPYTRTRTR